MHQSLDHNVNELEYQPSTHCYFIYQAELYKKGPFLVLPSSIAKNSSASNAKMIFEILWGVLEGRTMVPGHPGPVWKILFELGADEFLAMLEGKTRKGPFL